MANADTVAEVGKNTLGSLMARGFAGCGRRARPPLGRGGVTAVAEATGMSRTTIRAGVELQDPQGRREAEPAGVANVSVSATGSSSKTWKPSTRGDPQSPIFSRGRCGRGLRLDYRQPGERGCVLVQPVRGIGDFRNVWNGSPKGRPGPRPRLQRQGTWQGDSVRHL